MDCSESNLISHGHPISMSDVDVVISLHPKLAPTHTVPISGNDPLSCFTPFHLTLSMCHKLLYSVSFAYSMSPNHSLLLPPLPLSYFRLPWSPPALLKWALVTSLLASSLVLLSSHSSLKVILHIPGELISL